MKKYILLVLVILFAGCSDKIEVEPKTVIKDNYIFINKCEMIIPEELLSTDKIKVVKGNNEEEIKRFILDLYKNNKQNQSKIKTIKDIYTKYQECLKEDKK